MSCTRCRKEKKDDNPLVIRREPCYNKIRKSVHMSNLLNRFMR